MNKTVQYSEKDLASLISEVEDKFTQHLKKAETESEETKIEKSVDKADVKDLKKSEDKEDTTSPDYNDSDVVEMDEMYCSMTKAEKDAHYKSIKKSLFGKDKKELVKVEKKAEKSIAKSEDDGKVTELESKLEKTEEKYEDLQKNFKDLLSKLGGFMKKGTAAPKQKSITKIEYIKKSEDVAPKVEKKEEEDLDKLSKAEVTKRLTVKARNPKLAKTDRDAINSFYMEHKQDIESIRHLL